MPMADAAHGLRMPIEAEHISNVSAVHCDSLHNLGLRLRAGPGPVVDAAEADAPQPAGQPCRQGARLQVRAVSLRPTTG